MELFPFSLSTLFGAVLTTIPHLATYPLGRAKLLVQNQGGLITHGNQPYQGGIDCLKRIVKDEGVLSLWKGSQALFVTNLVGQTLTNLTILIVTTPAIKNAHFSKDLGLFGNIGVAGMIAARNLRNTQVRSLFLYPLQNARIRLTTDVLTLNKERHYKGVRDVFSQIIRSSGLIGLYKGYELYLIQSYAYRAIYFALQSMLRPTVLEIFGESMFVKFVLANVVTLIAGACTYPIQTLGNRVMMTPGKITLSTSYDILKDILENEGWQSLFQGVGLSLAFGITDGIVNQLFQSLLSSLLEG